MLLFLLNHKLLSGLIWLFILCGVGIQIGLGVKMQRLLDETDRMAVTKNPFLNLCKNCEEGTSPEMQVNQLLEKYRIGGCTIAAWKTLSGQAVMLAVVLSGVGVCIGIARGETIGSLLPYYVFCMIGLYAYFAIAGAVDVKGRMEKVREKLDAYFIQKQKERDKTPVQKEQDGEGQTGATGEKEQDCTRELVELLEELLI